MTEAVLSGAESLERFAIAGVSKEESLKGVPEPFPQQSMLRRPPV